MHLLLDGLGPARVVEPAIDDRAAVRALEILDVGVDHVAAEDDAEPFRGNGAGDESRVGDRQVGGGEAELDVAAHHLEAFAGPHGKLGIEVDDLAAELDCQARGVEARERPDAAHTGDDGTPERLAAHADRADDTEARDHDVVRRTHGRDAKPAEAWRGRAGSESGESIRTGARVGRVEFPPLSRWQRLRVGPDAAACPAGR